MPKCNTRCLHGRISDPFHVRESLNSYIHLYELCLDWLLMPCWSLHVNVAHAYVHVSADYTMPPLSQMNSNKPHPTPTALSFATAFS